MSTPSVQSLAPPAAIREAHERKPADAETDAAKGAAPHRPPSARSAAGTSSTWLNFRLDEGSGEMVLDVVDRESGRTLYQIPSEVALRIARHLSAGDQGLVDEIA